MAEYFGDLNGLLKSSKHIAAAFDGSQKMVPEFDETCDHFSGCWGEDGEGDELAEALNAKYRERRKSVIETATGVTEGIAALINAVAQQAEPIGRPQRHAIEDIENVASESEARR
ncbi:hypothetical protein [Streptomyces sp. NPDC056468]|uniref:hypothetical protein n=1 Tax=Streptomyces sp. NPDC056468 TaxID=3345830 RepID=UPI0036750E35